MRRSGRRGNNGVTLADVFISNSPFIGSVQSVERSISYENKTYVPLNRRHSADIGYDRNICGQSYYITNDDAIYDSAARIARCAKGQESNVHLFRRVWFSRLLSVSLLWVLLSVPKLRI